MTLPVGAAAPDFELRDQHGSAVRLADLRGTAVALLFYPYAFSRVCSGELAGVRDRSADFASSRARLLAISCDPVFTLRAFADQGGFAFPLLSDFWPHGQVATSYGVFDPERGCARRATVVVDAAGTVRWTAENPAPEGRDLAQLAAVLGDIGRESDTGQ